MLLFWLLEQTTAILKSCLIALLLRIENVTCYTSDYNSTIRKPVNPRGGYKLYNADIEHIHE